MELPPISASLGAMASLAGKLDALPDTELKVEMGKLRNWLVLLSKAGDPPETARIWMRDVREISYDMENYVDVAEPDWMDMMSGFKARVKEANERYESYELGKIPIRTDFASDCQISMVGGRQRRPGLAVVGLHDGPFHSLCNLLTDGDEDLKVLSIVGVGGIGKTTLAKELWRKHKPGEHFHCRAFVRTAKKADMRRILRSILAQVRPRQPPDTNEVHELIHDLTEHLRDKKYFLIIDDLWATSVWDVTRRALPKGNGSRIITTTEVETVALACCSHKSTHIFKMKPLSPNHSKELFSSGMFGSGGGKSHQLDELTAEIIGRCGGLPLAIISISSVIASLGEANTVHNREQVQNNLLANAMPDDMVKQALNICFNCLPSRLQTCLLYLSLYPENYVILMEDIVKQWVGEGFILAPTEKEKMEVAVKYFDKLVDMGMIQHIVVDYCDEVMYYAVHHMVHDFITSKSIQENFVTAIDYSQRAVRFSNKVSHLSLQFGSATYATTPQSIGLSQVRSLAFVGLKSCLPSILEFKLLRFLTIHMWADQPRSTGVDLKPTSELVLLRSLQVTCNDKVHLPDLMQGPIHLETLDINARVASIIPENIVHLRSWLHLRLGVGTELPDVTGILRNVTMYPPISLDESSTPPNSVTTIDLLLPISRIPKWIGLLTNLCILKLVVRELQMEGIINLQGLPFLTFLSLRVQGQTAELSFATGAFTALEYFEFRCGVLFLAFEEGAMPNLQRVKLGFNAHRGEQYARFLVGIEDMSSIQQISVLIGSPAGAEESDLEAAESALWKEIGRQYSKVSIKRSDIAEDEFDPPEKHWLIQEQHMSTQGEHHRRQNEPLEVCGPPEKQHLVQWELPSASREQPRHGKQKSQEEFDPREQQHLIGGKTPSALSEQESQRPKQESQEEFDRQEQEQSIRGKPQSASTEQPPRRKKKAETQTKQDFGTYSQSISRMPPPSAPSKNNNYAKPHQSAAIPPKNQQTSKTERSIAYLAAGLAKAVVKEALSKSQEAIKMEAKLPQRARHDLVFIADEFEFMKSLLTIIVKQERIENELVWTWVRKIHELAYSLEDCMELIVHLDTEKPSLWCRIRQRHWPWIPAPKLPLDQAADEIKYIKDRVADMGTRSMRYNLINDSGPAFSQQRWLAAVGDTIIASNMLTGDLTQLITNKTEDSPLQVISVWGTGGDLGKTSIIRKAYNDPEISQSFGCRSWVKLTHPFDPREFIRRFMAQVYANAHKKQDARIGAHVLAKMEASQEDLLEEFVKEVNSKTYLVVLENLTDIADWDAVRLFLPDMKKGSWIIVSTQQVEIASLCIGHSYKSLQLRQFSPDHSVLAFFNEGSQVKADKEEKPAVLQVNQHSFFEEVPLSNREAAITQWLKNNPLVGRESQMNELRGYIARARFSNSHVMSVWGIAGIGKSTLIRNLYYDRMLGTSLFNKYSWVDVSHPFNLRDFSRSLLLDFGLEKDPIEECRELLQNHTCLVVIDDLRSKEEWDLIQNALLPRTSSSVIIIITTEASVAAYSTINEARVMNVKALEADAALDLFRKEVHKKNSTSPLIHVTDLELDRLILKCGGLPKVIVAVAAILATQTVTLMDTVRSLNLRFMHHLENNLEYGSLRGQFGWMSTYFRDCPDSLKPCIFSLTIFPPDCNFRRRRLVRRWIAEGYCTDSDKKSAEEHGEEFFSKLLELSIIQQIPRTAKYHVNGFIREYIVSRRMEENLVFELGPRSILTTQQTGRHLIILRDWDRDKIVFGSIDFSRLRSMTVYGMWEPFFISERMKLLRVLDLEDALGLNDEDLEKMVKRFHRLKFLSLRGCNKICHLPSSVGNLRQLQSLDVRHTSIVTLPENITKLKKLQYIRAGTTIPATTPSASYNCLQGFRKYRHLAGVEMPREMGKLTASHTLGVVNINASGGKAIVKEIKKLTQLRKLGVSGINRRNSNAFFSSISGHVHLESLLVRLEKDKQGCFDDICLPWANLQSLKLYGLQDKLPLSGSQLSKLRKLDLEMDTLKQSDNEFLAKLPELCILRLRVHQLLDDKLHLYAEIVGCELITYEKVKILEIAYSSSQLHVIFGSKSMRNLEMLNIDCSSARYRLTGLSDLSELQQVLLKGTNDESIKTGLEEQFANHLKKPTVKLANTLS